MKVVKVPSFDWIMQISQKMLIEIVMIRTRNYKSG